MKKTYEEPKIDLLYLSSSDQILTSSKEDGFIDDSEEEFKGGDIIIIQ